MKKFTKIVLIISGICIIIGLALVIASGLTGAVHEMKQELEISVKAVYPEVVEEVELEDF